MRAIAAFGLLSTMVACASPDIAPMQGSSPKKSNSKNSSSDAGTPTTQTPDSSSGSNDSSDSNDSTTATPIGLSWNSLGDYVYSLDVETSNGEWIGPCLDESVIGNASSFTYQGVCSSSANQAVPNPAAYRLYYSRSNTAVRHWQDYVEVTPTSPSGSVVFSLPTTAPSSVSLSWSQRSPTAQYSLDVFLVSGEKVRPCVNADSLGKSTSFSFNGNCSAPPASRRVELKDVTDFVICSAENGNWNAATCAGIPYSGFGATRVIP